MSEQNNNWERGVLEKLAMSAVQEQRRARHWSIFFKTLTFAYLFIVLALVMGWMGSSKAEKALGSKHTALVELNGVIASDKAASADNGHGTQTDGVFLGARRCLVILLSLSGCFLRVGGRSGQNCNSHGHGRLAEQSAIHH